MRTYEKIVSFKVLFTLFVLCLLLLAKDCFAQNARFDGVVQARSGFPAPGAKIAVCTQPCTVPANVSISNLPSPLASLCSSASDVGCTSPNPVTADGLGNYSFYVLPGKYTVVFFGSGLTARTQVDQIFPCDPSNCSLTTANFSGAVTVGGTLGVKIINSGPLHAAAFTGSGANDMCNKIVAAGAALTVANGPGIIDATEFTGTQACSVDPIGSLNPYTMILLGNVTINTAVQWNFQKNGISVRGWGPSQTRIYYTGSGAVTSVIKFSSPATPTGFYNAELSDLSVAGNTHTTSVIDGYNFHKINLNRISTWAATTQCIYIESSILDNFYNIDCDVADTNAASLGLPATPVPTNGIVLNQNTYNAVLVQVTAGTFVDVNVHGVGAGKAIWLEGASSLTFTSGTSEGNTGCGLQIDAPSAENTIIGMDLEANNATCDVLDNGIDTHLINIIGISATPAISAGASSQELVLEGGNLSNVTLNAAAKFPRWTDGNRVKNACPWTVTDNSTQTCWNDLGQGETDIANNTFTGANNYAIRFKTANSTNTAFNELGGFDQDGQFKIRSSTGVYGTINGALIGWNNAGQAENDYSTSVFTGATNFSHLFNVPNAGNTAWVQAGGFLQNGQFKSNIALLAGGSAAGLTGTGACATITTQHGGAWAGDAKCTGATAASTLTITPGATAPNGWICNVQDETTRANLFQQTSHSPTTCVLTVTSVTQNDVFVFSAIAY